MPAVTTDAQVCNLALGRIGFRQYIAALDEANAASQACAVFYNPSLFAVLESFAWPFATHRAALVALSGVTRDGWAYVYQLPSDFVAAQSLYPGTRVPSAAERTPYAIEHEPTTDSLVLATDLQGAKLKYTYASIKAAFFSPLFVEALSWKLAGNLAMTLPVKPGTGKEMLQGYRGALAEAIASQLNQQQEDQPPDSEFITVRK